MKASTICEAVTNSIGAEVSTAIKTLKVSKAVSVSNILSEFLHNIGPLTTL